MMYTVEANNLYHPVRPSAHDAVDEALARAVELMAKGARDVDIIDAEGRRFTRKEPAREDAAPDREGSGSD